MNMINRGQEDKVRLFVQSLREVNCEYDWEYPIPEENWKPMPSGDRLCSDEIVYYSLEEPLGFEETQGQKLESYFRKRIIGQDLAVESVVAALLRKTTIWHSDDKPIVLLFLGSSGLKFVLLLN